MEYAGKRPGTRRVQRKKQRKTSGPALPFSEQSPAPTSQSEVLYLQRTIGNQAVQKLLGDHPRSSRKPVNLLRKPASPVIQRDWMDDLGNAASSTYDSVSNAAGSAYDSAKSAASDAYNAVSDTASSAYNAVSDTASSAYNAVSDTASSAYNTVSNAAGSAYDSAKSAVDSFDVDSFVSGLRAKVEAHARGMLPTLSQEVTTFSENSKAQLGDLPELPDSLKSTAQQLAGAIQTGSDDDTGTVDTLWSSLKEGSARLEQAGPVVNSIGGEIGKIEKKIQKIADSIRKEVNDLIDGTIAGVVAAMKAIQPYIAAIKKWVEDLIDGAIDLAKKAIAAIEALIKAIKPYLDKPWFWLNLGTAGLYGVIARRAFKAGYSHYLPRKLIDHYADFGGPLTLTAKEMDDCGVVANIAKSPDFVTKAGDLHSRGGGTEHITLKGHAVADTHGTLGNFTITYDGNLTVGATDWSFNGQMSFYDFWDFDPKPFGKGGRSTYGEILTRIGDWFLPGAGFDINSVNVPFKQSNSDAEGNWSGKGIPGTPSRLANLIGGESTGESKESGG